MANVTIYDNAHFQGRSKELIVGDHVLDDFNDMTSSIKVPDGLVALVYENADSGGGYGISADLLEDCADLAPLNLNDKISYITVFHKHTSGRSWIRGTYVRGNFVAGHWETQSAGEQVPPNHVVVVSPPIPPHVPVEPKLIQLLDISRSDGSPWTNRTFDTSDPNWSSNVVGGHTFDGSSAHPFEWVSVLNPGQEQDDEVGLAGTALSPDVSGADLPFTHPFGSDFEFTIIPDPAYDGLLATANKDAIGVYGNSWTEAQAAAIPIPTGVLGLEIDAALVPPHYRPANGDRVAVYGRWIVDAGHPEFHTEIHPPLLMARAQSVDSSGNPVDRSAPNAMTLVQVWSRPYQAGQKFSTNGDTGLALKDYATRIAETPNDIRAYPPVFPKPFQGSHLVSFTIRPPAPITTGITTGITTTAPTRQLQCSYHFIVNGSCNVEVMRSPADANSVLVILRLDAAGYPTLPEPPSGFDQYSIQELLSQAPSGIDLSWYEKDWLGYKGTVYVRRYTTPQGSLTQGGVNVVPFTPLNVLPRSSQATDKSQPFPIYGWVKLQWVDLNSTVQNG